MPYIMSSLVSNCDSNDMYYQHFVRSCSHTNSTLTYPVLTEYGYMYVGEYYLFLYM